MSTLNGIQGIQHNHTLACVILLNGIFKKENKISVGGPMLSRSPYILHYFNNQLLSLVKIFYRQPESENPGTSTCPVD